MKNTLTAKGIFPEFLPATDLSEYLKTEKVIKKIIKLREFIE